MPPAAYALVTLFVACSVVAGIVAVRLAARVGGPTRRAAYVLPVLAGFGTFYLIGHKHGLSVGPEISLFGFQVALLGDMAHSLVFDNSKIRRLVPDFVCPTTFAEGAREIVAWYDANPSWRVGDPEKEATMDWLAEAYRPRGR